MSKDTPSQPIQSKKRDVLPKHLEHINQWAAGIDVGSISHFVAVPEGCDEKTVREFKSFTTGLNEMADWLKQCGIKTIAMESTGVYWVRHDVAMQTVAADSHLRATYCSVSSSLLGHAIGVFVRYRKKYKVTTNSKHKQPVFENKLNRQFIMEKPNQAYASDITYIWTQEGWLYLAVVIDLFSRKIVGWSMSSRMKAELACDALKMALWQRKPEKGLIVHSDRGIQYASKSYRALLTTHGCVGSMSKKGDCWDNAVPESFFGRLKQERVMWRNYQTRFEAQQDILNYITMHYNSKRLHSFLGYRAPNQFEMDHLIQFKNVA